MERTSAIQKAHEYIDREFPAHLEICRRFLRQKSISATGEGIKETAAMVRDYIRQIGGSTEYCGEDNFPIV